MWRSFPANLVGEKPLVLTAAFCTTAAGRVKGHCGSQLSQRGPHQGSAQLCRTRGRSGLLPPSSSRPRRLVGSSRAREPRGRAARVPQPAGFSFPRPSPPPRAAPHCSQLGFPPSPAAHYRRAGHAGSCSAALCPRSAAARGRDFQSRRAPRRPLGALRYGSCSQTLGLRGGAGSSGDCIGLHVPVCPARQKETGPGESPQRGESRRPSPLLRATVPARLPMSMAKRLAFSRLRKISSGGRVMLLSKLPCPPLPLPPRSAILNASPAPRPASSVCKRMCIDLHVNEAGRVAEAGGEGRACAEQRLPCARARSDRCSERVRGVTAVLSACGG